MDKSDYVSRMQKLDAQCRYLEEQAAEEYKTQGKHTKQECVYLQQAASKRQEMSSISTGEMMEYQISKKNELDKRIREIIQLIDPELYSRYVDRKQGRPAPAGKKSPTPKEADKQAVQKDDTIDTSTWFQKAPEHSFDDVSGMEEFKKKLRECVLDSGIGKLKDYLGVKRLHSYFFFGPPGCGKTFIIEAYAHELMKSDYKYLKLCGADILSRFVGDGEKVVKRLFEEARDNAPCIVFVDEIDGVCKDRNLPNLPEYSRTLTTSFLEGYNSIIETTLKSEENQDPKPIIFIGATNYPGLVDNAMMDRVELLRVPLPDTEAREKAFERNFEGKIQFSDEHAFHSMAEATEKYNYRDIDRLTGEIKNLVIKDIMKLYQDEGKAIEALQSGEYKASPEILNAACQNCLPSPKDQIISSLDAWEKKYRSGLEEE